MDPSFIIPTRKPDQTTRNRSSLWRVIAIALIILFAVLYWNATIVLKVNGDGWLIKDDSWLVKPAGHIIPRSAHGGHIPLR